MHQIFLLLSNVFAREASAHEKVFNRRHKPTKRYLLEKDERHALRAFVFALILPLKKASEISKGCGHLVASDLIKWHSLPLFSICKDLFGWLSKKSIPFEICKSYSL